MMEICKNCGKSFDTDEEGWTMTEYGLFCPECTARESEPETEGESRLAVHEESDKIESPPIETISDDELMRLYTGNQEPDDVSADEEPKKRSFKDLFKDLFKFKKGKDRILKRRNPKSDDDYDVDSFHERKRRHDLIRKEGYVILKTLTREPNGDYMLESTLVKFEDLPRDAVAVTGEKNTYCLDKIKTSSWYLSTHTDPLADYYESQFTASDAYLYMTSNKIDNALAIRWTEMSHVDFKKYIWIAVIGLVVVLFLIMRMRG